MKTLIVLLLAATVYAACKSRHERLDRFRKLSQENDARQMLSFNTRPRVGEDPELEGVCKGRDVGNYQHPSDCSKYVACKEGSNGVVMHCPTNLHFNRVLDECVKPEKAFCLIEIGQTSYGAKGDKPGKVSLSQLPKGVITQVKLEHVSGFLTCSVSSLDSKWGCNNQPSSYNSSIIGTVVTNTEKKIIFEESLIPGYDGNSPFIVFNQFRNQATSEQIRTDSLPNRELDIWYKEDLLDVTESDNNGNHEIKVYVTVEADTEPELEGICKGREPGNYQHPTDCTKYVACSGSYDFVVMHCPTSLHFNRVLDECVKPEKAFCLIEVGQTSYGAKDNKPGKVSLSQLPKGVITQVKLEHVSGFLKCSVNSLDSKWGCNNQPSSFNSSVIGTLMTNTEKKIIFEEVLIPGYDGNSQFIVFNQFRNQATSEPIRIDSLPNMELDVWYKEDLFDVTEFDNSGIHAINVYVTVEADADKQLTQSSRAEIEPELEGICEGRKAGNYQHPSDCTKYVECTESHEPIVMPCPRSLHFNRVLNKCVEPDDAYCLIRVGKTSYGAKGNQLGKVSLSKLPKGVITQVKLEHVSGYVQCSQSSKSRSYWGCNDHPGSYNSSIIGTVITNTEKKIIIEEILIPGYDGNSSFIVFNQFRNQATSEPIRTDSLPNIEMNVWYKEDLLDVVDSDNSGIHEINVYVTVEADADQKLTQSSRAEIEPELEGVCEGRDDGNYQHPSDCTKYVACTENHKPIALPCSRSLHYNRVLDKCVKPDDSHCLIRVGQTSYGQKRNQPGKVSLSKLPKGVITQVKLEHVSGFVECLTDKKKWKWGCINRHGRIGTVITNTQKKIIIEEMFIPGYDGNSTFIVFNQFRNRVSSEQIRTDSLPNMEMDVWYKEDLTGNNESNNSGNHKINVFVTVEVDADYAKSPRRPRI